jgi:hypothetical protein
LQEIPTKSLTNILDKNRHRSKSIQISTHKLILKNMKKLFFLGLLLSAFTTLNAQDAIYQHKGFYLSLGAGPVFGKVTDEVNENGYKYTMDMTGTGAEFDFKIGGAIKENLILHATLVSRTMKGPNVTYSNGNSMKSGDNLNIGEAMFGAGVTYYAMPVNMLFSGTLGLGNFSVIDTENSGNNVSTQRGFSLQLKVGKEWKVSKKWGLGVAFTYGKTSLTNVPSANLTEKMNSNRLGILFNASLN